MSVRDRLTFHLITEGHMDTTRTVIIRSGLTFGTALAIAISWSVNKSILWAILHGFFSWLYVIYYAIVR